MPPDSSYLVGGYGEIDNEIDNLDNLWLTLCESEPLSGEATAERLLKGCYAVAPWTQSLLVSLGEHPTSLTED